MQFNKLEIERDRWGSDKGKLKGSVYFSNEAGCISLKLNQSHIDKIFDIVADSMIETAKDAANELTVNIIEHKDNLLVNND